MSFVPRPDANPPVVIDQRDRVARTVMIATASRRELESMCAQFGVPHASQPSATLREALKQRLLVTRQE